MDDKKLAEITNITKRHKNYDLNMKDATNNKMFYTGVIDDKILFQYREDETDPEKKQRKRLYIARTKHTISTIENVLDSLPVLDTTAVKITHKSENIAKAIEALMYEMNIEDQAFNYIKHSTLIDSNSFLISGLDSDGDIMFEYVNAENVVHSKIVNDDVRYLSIHIPSGDPKELDQVKVYTKDSIISGTVDKQGKFTETERQKVNMCYAYHCGYKVNAATNFKTYKTILDSASELLKELVYSGSEYDIIKNCHGIEKTFAFAPVCDYSAKVEAGIEYCRSGTVYMGEKAVRQCNVCAGSGLKVHTSSQNMIYLPEPRDKQEFMGLDKLVHTVHIEAGLIKMIREDVVNLESQIIRTIFNSNTVVKDEFSKTATEVKIDQNGVYSALSLFGQKVSNTVIWMVRIIADIKKVKNIGVYHGYSMELNIDGIMDMIASRKAAQEANLSYDSIKVFDYGILRKQHMDNPEYLNRYSVWETFKPFSDKSEGERQAVLASLPDNHRDRVLYYWFAAIQNKVLEANEKFFDLERSKQQALIDIAIDEIIATLSPQEPTRANLSDISNEDDSVDNIEGEADPKTDEVVEPTQAKKEDIVNE